MNNICTDLYKDFLYFHPTVQDKFINFYKKNILEDILKIIFY